MTSSDAEVPRTSGDDTCWYHAQPGRATDLLPSLPEQLLERVLDHA